MGSVQHLLRRLVYPGLDLHTRNRASLCRFWRSGARDVLDAGSGNGYFSWLAYRSGARVVAVNVKRGEVKKAEAFLIGYCLADPERLRFEAQSLYDLNPETERFDEIICYETLEHIRRDEEVCRQFFSILRPRGVLHLCSPNRLHPRHRAEVLDKEEEGGHVRPGYTEEDYRRLLAPIGFEIELVIGLGTPSVFYADRLLRAIRSRLGDIFALPLLPFCLPIVRFARLNPPEPFSLYVRAVKPAAGVDSGDQRHVGRVSGETT